MIMAIVCAIAAMLVHYELLAGTIINGVFTVDILGISFTTASLAWLAVSGIVVSYLISPAGAHKVVDRVASGVSDVVSTVADAGANTVSNIASTLIHNPIVLLGLGFVGYKMLKDE